MPRQDQISRRQSTVLRHYLLTQHPHLPPAITASDKGDVRRSGFTVQTWREKRTVERVVTGDGAVVDVEVVSRHAQIGRFEAR